MIPKNLIPFYTNISKEDYEYKFSVFTPVYNRADTLHRVFDSLNNQTFKDFELILINDGSNDNSHEVIVQLIETANFKVQYINNEVNRHKMACFIQAIGIANGEFILPFDSDDECSDDALEVFYSEYKNIPEEKKSNISGVTCLCNDQNGKLIGKPFTSQPYYSNTFNENLKNNDSLEKWGFTKTSILKGITVNDKIYSKGYIPEGIIWELISKEGFQTKYINNVLRTYYLDTGNRISNQNHKNDAFGMALYSLSILNWFYKDFFIKSPKLFIKRIYTLLRAARYLDFSFSDYLKSLNSNLIKFFFIIGWPFKTMLK